ncbi:MAG: hydroxymethylglutaryl-CoA reductase, degradative [Desulfurococcales archaeon]|nr:hydroxymethylglutaryl-CoA reductase, degradative [Desulfurococcales archaeon]
MEVPVENSRISGFYKKSIEERVRLIKDLVGLSDEDIGVLRSWGNLDPKIADAMIENVVGAMSYPFAIATNFKVNGKDYLVPMVIEESSVVAAASNAARVMRKDDGIKAVTTGPVMISQIQLVNVKAPYYAKMKIIEYKEEILELANKQDPVLVKLGGGAKDLEVRVIGGPQGPMVVTHLIVDVRDAMGANAVNTMAEKVAPLIERITGGKVYLRILTNLAEKRLARAWVKVYKEDIGGEEAVDGIVAASDFAWADPYRAATHNKGIMNGIIAVALATGQDHRALEAGAHAYAARNGRYMPLSLWEKDEEGNLVGSLELPIAVGLVGGAVKVHPVARLAIKILGVETAQELAEIMAAVGLAQNFAALRALATEGIQKGHMKLHAKNIAIMAGASPELADKIADIMVSEGNVRFDRAKELLEELGHSSS